MKKTPVQSSIFLFLLIAFTPAFMQAQITTGELTGRVNIISAAVPFLDIAPDSRAGAMGNAGVALSPDVNSQHWNPAKYAFIDKETGVAVSYTPWLRKLVNDINLYYLTGFKRLDDMQTISASLRYFTLGDITFTDESGVAQYTGRPNEFAFDAAYSRVLSDNFSGAVAFRYIRSDLTSGYSSDGNYTAGNSFAADLAFFFQNDIQLGRQDSKISAGINISNIGKKISYDNGNIDQFIPTNLRLGAALESEIDSYNSITFAVDLNKLLVPTPDVTDDQDGLFQSDNVSVVKGMFQSFSDAPGGFEEELQEINISVGAEYWYDKQFAARAGYFYEHENKGNRKYFTAGVGLKFNMLSIDASYLIPVAQNNPLANTVRFTLGVDLDQVL
jgi:hypothetical protein